MRKPIQTIILTIFFVLSFIAVADDNQILRDRLKPVDKVCLVGEECAGKIDISGKAQNTRTAEDIVKIFCNSCHGFGIGGAPKIGDVESWKLRFDAKGIDGLMHSAINGVPDTTMPARGNCLNCTDEELLSALKFMSKLN